MSIGDWRFPLEHSDHSGLMSPQYSGPLNECENVCDDKDRKHR